MSDSNLGNPRRPVSIIIPCYNQGRFLGDAIGSAIAQSYAPIETIVVDDGSSDDTPTVASRFPGVVLLTQNNSGCAVARNEGLRVSRGSYVLFLDADDRLLPGAIEAGVAALEEDPSCGFVWGRVRIVDGQGRFLREPNEQPNPEQDPYLALLRHNFIWTPGAVLYRREAVESVGGFWPALRGAEDFDLNLRIASSWPIRSHGHPVLEYRDHGTSKSANAALMLQSLSAIRRRRSKLARGDTEERKALEVGLSSERRYYGKKLRQQILSDARAGRWGQAVRKTLVLLRHHPVDLAYPVWRQ